METQYGDTVTVVGSVPDMGAWQPMEGLRMSTTEQMYPIWHCEPLLLSTEATEIEYKFIVICAGGHICWEPLLHNRRLVLEESEAKVMAEWGSPSVTPRTAFSSEKAFQLGASDAASLSIGGALLYDTYATALRGSSVALNQGSSRSIFFTDGLSSSSSDSTAALRPEVSRLADGVKSGGGGNGEANASVHLPLGKRTSSLVERLLLVQQYLPFNVWRAEDGRWMGAWDEWALLATPAQGGRHLMGSLNIEVPLPPPPSSPPPRPHSNP